jgi:histidine triad (HIT) family protein
MSSCIFCQIASGESPSEKVMETDNILVFKNIKPITPIHLLIIPKKHYTNLLVAPSEIWSEIQEVIKKLAKQYDPKGFRISTNVGDAAMIEHMHVHFLAPVTKDRQV